MAFQGERVNEESGLCYNRYQYYNLQNGRYISQNPVGLAGGINTYT
ncbi:hypothetical protein [Metakosakonia massiliensis]